MPQLRWTLLALGALFIAILAWWERRKPRQALRSANEPTISPELLTPRAHESLTHATDPITARAQREPTLILPEMRARAPGMPHELPAVDVADAGQSAADPRIEGPRVEHHAAVEPVLLRAEPNPGTAEPPALEAQTARERTGGIEVPTLTAPAAPLVEWPADRERQILALRIVSVSPERFSGRVVRTALVAEGFVHGKFSIFHKTGGDGRALLSAASLSKPGDFDLETIDTQRYSGLSLFAVLPGPKPAREAFEDLLSTARNLNERLQGGLQDEQGGPLTASRIALLRQTVAVAASREQGPEAGP